MMEEEGGTDQIEPLGELSHQDIPLKEGHFDPEGFGPCPSEIQSA
jgi:hypothetical protein